MSAPLYPAIYQGDNLEILRTIPDATVDLVYLDPPFFTGKQQTLLDRTLTEAEGARLSFEDVWDSLDQYIAWIHVRLVELHRVLKPSGSIFLHCDWRAAHWLRVELDRVFGTEQFRSEIIWYYKRWTNSKRNFQGSHQTIYFYSKTDQYKFNQMYEDYSYTTNIDQIWQKRGRDKHGKSITLTSDNGEYVAHGDEKPGVPMRDVWEIPYLNPRAKERTGWPTQKPVELLKRIVLACTDQGDVVLDPVCGSGTTLVAAKVLGRNWIGIDRAAEAIEISKRRIESEAIPTSTKHHAPYRLAKFLQLPRVEKVQAIAAILGMNIAHRSQNLDGFLKRTFDGANVAVKYLDEENHVEAIERLIETATKKQCSAAVVVMPRVSQKEKAELEIMFGEKLRTLIFSYDMISKTSFDIEVALREHFDLQGYLESKLEI